MIKPHVASITEGIADSQTYADWSGAVGALYESIHQHPSGNLEKIDIKNVDHLQAQIAVLEGTSEEKTQRDKLKLEIASRQFDSLDIIGKLSLLYCLSMFNPVAAPTYTFNVMKMRLGDDPAYKRAEFGVRAKRIDPGSAAMLLSVAQELDTQVRLVDGVVKDGVKVWVKDKKRWSEFRTLYRAGNRKTFEAENVTEGVITDKDKQFPIQHPVVKGRNIWYEVPHALNAIEITHHKSRSSRDIGYIGKTDSLLDVDYKDGRKYMRVPLIAIMQAKGLESGRYATPFRHDQGASVEVKIGRHTLPASILPEIDRIA